MTQARRGWGAGGCSLIRPWGKSRSQGVKGDLPTCSDLQQGVNPRETVQLSINLVPVQNRCQGATRMGHALTQPFTDKRFTLCDSGRGNPQTLRGFKWIPNYSEQTFQVLQDHRGLRILSQAETETGRELSTQGQLAATDISSGSQTWRHAFRETHASCHTSAKDVSRSSTLPACAMLLESCVAEDPPIKVDWRDPAPQFSGIPMLLLCASNATQTFWGEEAEDNPSKRRSRADGAWFLIQRVVAVPRSCQRCQQQPSRLRTRVSCR